MVSACCGASLMISREVPSIQAAPQLAQAGVPDCWRVAQTGQVTIIVTGGWPFVDSGAGGKLPDRR